eukprot:scaffold54669_cov58-Phaeocystis_antarctica.AAC.3
MTVAGGVAGPARVRPRPGVRVRARARARARARVRVRVRVTCADAPLQRVREHDDPEGGGAHRLAQPPALHGRGRPSRLRRAVCDARVAVRPQPDVLRPGAEHDCRDRHVGEQRDSGAQVRAAPAVRLDEAPEAYDRAGRLEHPRRQPTPPHKPLLQARGDRSCEAAEAESSQEAEGQHERRPVVRERHAGAREGKRGRADSDAATATEAVHGAADWNLDGSTEEGTGHVASGDGRSR